MLQESSRRSAPGRRHLTQRVVGAYLRSYGGVDRADRGMANYSIAHKCRRWYMTIVFWLLDAVLWNMWVEVKYAIDMKHRDWTQYDPKSGGVVRGRMRFMLDLSNALMDYAAKNTLKAAGGNRDKVKWFNHSRSTKLRAKTTPGRVSLAEHTAELHDHTNRYCQHCYSKTGTSWPKSERRKGSNSTQHKCR